LEPQIFESFDSSTKSIAASPCNHSHTIERINLVEQENE
jgi:hypothetical protein